MKALTVHQPWAWALIHSDKTENRSWATKHRGPLAIHAGGRWSQRGADFEPLQRAYASWLGFDHWEGHYGGHTAMPIEISDERDRLLLPLGAIIGVANLVDVHREEGGCCAPWGETSYVEHGGRTRTDIHHWVFEDRRPLDEPIPCRGAQQLWTPPPHVIEQLEAA